MKKAVSILLVAVMAVMLAIPVFAEDVEWVRVISITDNAVLALRDVQPITEQEMLDAAAASEGILPEGAEFKYMRVLYQNRISCEEEICDLALRVWGSRNLVALLFFKGDQDEAWTLIGRNIGEVIDVCMFANGQIAVAYAS